MNEPQGRKTRHRIRCKGRLTTTTPIWVRKGRCASVDGAAGLAVHVVAVRRQSAAKGAHDEALLRLHRLTEPAAPPILPADNLT